MVVVDIFRNQGIKGLHRGVCATAQREEIGEVVYFCTYDATLKFFANGYKDNAL